MTNKKQKKENKQAELHYLIQLGLLLFVVVISIIYTITPYVVAIFYLLGFVIIFFIMKKFMEIILKNEKS